MEALMFKRTLISTFFGLISAVLVSQAVAQTAVMKQFSPFSGGAQGLYWVPSSGPISHTAFLVIHRTSDYLSQTSTQELPKRGFSVLGMASRFKGNEAGVNWELLALDVRAGVRFLRSQPGITRVVLIGPSEGGAVTSYYQAVAENGLAFCQAPNKLTQCSSSQLAGFIPADRADGLVFLDATLGSVSPVQSLNGAVQSEINPKNTSANLDPFSVRNGFNPDGDSVYSADFVKRYTDAQSRRMNELIDIALKTMADIEAGKHFPTENDAFVIYRGSAELADLSTGVLCCTLNPRKLLKNNGTIDNTQIVRTVRVSEPSGREEDASFEGARFLTLTSFLSSAAIRSTNSLDGIDWCSSNASTICAVANISAPILVMPAQGHNLIRDGEQIFEMSKSNDKDYVVIEGATHGFAPCTECSAIHGGADYSNARTNSYDYVRDWANARF